MTLISKQEAAGARASVGNVIDELIAAFAALEDEDLRGARYILAELPGIIRRLEDYRDAQEAARRELDSGPSYATRLIAPWEDDL